MRRWTVLAMLTLAGCGRYDDFTLPVVQRTPLAGHWEWEPHVGPVLGRGAKGEWDSVDTLNPSVVRHGNQLFNFYSGFDGQTWHTGLALSADGLSWKRQEKLLSPTGWEGDYIAANGSALRAGTEFLYWYQGGTTPRIGLARSADGNAWRREPRPVLELGPRGSWDERGVADPYVVHYGGVYYMYYLGEDRARRQRLGVARSPDGVTWTKLRASPIVEMGDVGSFDENGLGEPAVWFSNGSYWMLYTGRDHAENRRMGFARSQDGVQWQKIAAPVIGGTEEWNSRVVCDATVEVAPEGVRVWFGGGNVAHPAERLNGQIGYGILRWRADK